MQPSDAVLIEQWRQGDAAAFAVLVHRWQQPMARFFTRWLGRDTTVADLCQEVFLRLYLAGPRYRESGSFRTWIYRIALNLARDAGRRRGRDPEPLANGEAIAPIPAPDDLCARAELGRIVARYVTELAEPLREVLVLRHYEELSFEEIARLTGTSASTLKSRFAVALSRLRDRLQERGCD